MAGACGLATIVGGYALAHAYVQSVAADPATSLAGVTYLYWFIPGMALQFALVALGSALRGTGIVKPTMVVQMVTVVLNVVLAPILIAGWGTGHAMGVAGAGLASSLAIAVAVGMLWWYFQKLEKFVHFDRTLFKPRSTAWARILHVGLPAGGEFALMFVFMGVIYWAIRDFGPQAQAGFGIGSRVMQAIFLPAMAIAFAAGPIAGQNFGAKRFDRVRETFAKAALLSSVVMALLTVFAHWRPDILVRGFTTEPEVVAIGVRYLQVMSWNFVAQGLIFTCSSMFQGLGNTQPAMLSMASRLPTFVLPIIWLSSQPNFSLEIVWYVSVASVAVQAVVSLVLLYRQFRARLPAQSAAVTA
jgi:putative MATE family efflux protein